MSCSYRIGHGYDVHKFIKGRKCVLCGVIIPFELGLEGHSDADVPVHALMDAMLGALALGDIGHCFPDNDPLYSDANSVELLKIVNAKLLNMNWQVANADITIIAQKPKLASYILDMRHILADALAVSPDSVSVKATTEEGLGFTGAMEGISAHAVVLLERNC